MLNPIRAAAIVIGVACFAWGLTMAIVPHNRECGSIVKAGEDVIRSGFTGPDCEKEQTDRQRQARIIAIIGAVLVFYGLADFGGWRDWVTEPEPAATAESDDLPY